MKKNVVLLTLFILFILPVYFGEATGTQKAAKQEQAIVKKGAVKVFELQSIEQLKDAFQKESGKVRLVTILSPN